MTTKSVAPDASPCDRLASEPPAAFNWPFTCAIAKARVTQKAESRWAQWLKTMLNPRAIPLWTTPNTKSPTGCFFCKIYDGRRGSPSRLVGFLRELIDAGLGGASDQPWVDRPTPVGLGQWFNNQRKQSC